MKRFLLALILSLLPIVALAQCNGVFPSNTLCGNTTGSPAIPIPSTVAGPIVGGPGSSVVNDVAVWNNTTGTLLKDVPFGGLNYTQSANGTGVLRTAQTKLDDAVSVKDFGVKCDNSTDDTAAIVVADVAAAAVGKALRFPAGICIVSATITPSTGAHWIGDGYAATTLKRNNATCAILTISNSFVTIDEFSFASTVTCTSGTFIALSGNNFTAHDLYATAAFTCFTMGTSGSSVSVAVVLIDQLQCLNTVAGQNSITINNTGGGNIEMRNIFANNSAGARPFSHINFINSPDFTCVDCNLLSAQNNIYINPASGQSVVSTNFIGGFSDQASINAVAIVPSGTGFVGRSRFLGFWFFCSNSSCNGFDIATAGTSNVDGIDCTACDIYSNSATTTNGVVTSQGAGTTIKNVSINGSRIAGWTNGVNIGGLISGSIKNSKIGSNGNFAVNTTGIALGGTIGTLSVTTNDLTGNTTPLSNSSTPTLLQIVSNIGYNPVGPVAAISVGASPFTYTAGPSPETVYLNGGTVSLVETANNGTFVTVLVTTNTSAYLGPNEQLRVTYTAAPTMVKAIH